MVDSKQYNTNSRAKNHNDYTNTTITASGGANAMQKTNSNKRISSREEVKTMQKSASKPSTLFSATTATSSKITNRNTATT